MTRRDGKVVEITRSRVKIKSKLTNLMKLIQIEGYNGKYGSNPQGIRENSEEHFMKEHLKTNPRNQKSMNFTLISQRN